MLFLVFHMGEDRYAIDASRAVEVLPLVNWKQLPGAPAGVAGVFNYHGTPVPLLDLSELIANRTSRRWMSTRIIVVNRVVNRDVNGRSQSSGETGLLGLLAEKVTETLRLAEGDFEPSGVTHGSAPYLGGIAIRGTGMIQRIEIEHLLPADVEAGLLQGEAESV